MIWTIVIFIVIIFIVIDIVKWIDMWRSGNHTIQFVYSTPSSGQYATVDMVYYTWD